MPDAPSAPARTEPARTESARTESARTESARTESARTESARTDPRAAAGPSGDGLALVADLLRCPVRTHTDETGLRLEPGGLVCPAGHRFDRARQGHVNLLQGPAGANADTAAMVAARERMLGSGLYRPMTAAVTDLLTDLGPDAVLLESGAGPAHHLATLVDPVPGWRGLATDVSVAAGRRAARAHPRIGAVLADSWRPWPVLSTAVDAVLAIFAPRNPDETARVLGPGGLWVVVTPEPDHLAELRASGDVVGIETDKVARLRRQSEPWFTEEAVADVSRTVELTGEQVADLVAMGPSAHHASAAPAGRPRTVTWHVRVARYRLRDTA